jgi:flavin-dependent dehydrogenase
LADVDVFIAGAGPAGCATAISLAQFAPELRVALADAPPREELRIGETVPPPIRTVLRHLGVWERFERDGHCRSYRTLAAWGSGELGSNELLLHPQQFGWRLDRARFDAMMVEAAGERVLLHVGARVTGVEREGESGWRVTCGDGTECSARFVVDATGRARALARLAGLRPVKLDELVGCFVYFERAGDDGSDGEGGGDGDRVPELMVETFCDGWWYTAAVPEGRHVVACMTDADLMRRLGIARLEPWLRTLAETRHVARVVAGWRPLGPPRLLPAGSHVLSAEEPPSWISVGDAASTFDPVSGQGIFKALRSGIFASYAITDWLLRGDRAGLQRYRAFVSSEFAAYRNTLRDYYAVESRWPDSAFWQRRQGEMVPPRSHEPVGLQLAAGP